MGLLARAGADRLQVFVAALGPLPSCMILRGPEPGLVMVRGRTGASGAPFNLGEMTVTRCSVRLTSGAAMGAVGHAYVSGRNTEQARLAAILDAMLLASERVAEIERAILAPLEAAAMDRRNARARQSAATKVDFFTMVRSEHGGRD